MKKPKNFTDEMVEIYNLFVSLSRKNGVVFQYVNVRIGENYDGIVGLHLEIETDLGFTKEEMKRIYGAWTDKYPWCGVTYNVREVSALEKACISEGVKILKLSEGLQLDYIK